MPLPEEVEDLSWSEVGKLAQSYLRIPLALLLVEMFYWFITQPTNTLGLIQESEAWIWYHLLELITAQVLPLYRSIMDGPHLLH